MNEYGDRCAKCVLGYCDPGLLSCGDSPTSPRMGAAAADVGWDPTIATQRHAVVAAVRRR